MAHKYIYLLLRSITGIIVYLIIVYLIPAVSQSLQLQLLYLHTQNTDGTLKLLHFISENPSIKAFRLETYT